MTRRAKAFLAAAVLTGCASTQPTGLRPAGRASLLASRSRPSPVRLGLSLALPISDFGDGGASVYPALAREPAALLASEAAVSGGTTFETPGAAPPLQEVTLPDTDGWPRVFPDAGPFYVLGQFSPYVGQFGVLKDEKRADDGYGIGAVFGYRLPFSNALALGLEFQLELSEHKNPSADVAAHQTRIGLGVRAMFKFDEVLRPFGVVGFGQYDMTFDSVPSDFHLSGLGLFLGGGADYVYMDSLTIRGEITYHFWDAAEKGSGDGGMGQTLFLGVGAAYSF